MEAHVANLVETILSAISPDMVSKIAGLFGESSDATGRGLTAAVPALLGGALQQSSRPGGATNLVNLIRETTSGGNPLDQVGSLLSNDDARGALMGQGGSIVSSLLGGGGSGVTNALASFSGVRSGSMPGLLALAAPLVMGAIGKATGPAPTPSSVQSLLTGQRASIVNALPAGLGSTLGLGDAGATVASAASTAQASAAGAAGGARRILPGLLLGGLAALLLIFGLRTWTQERAGPTLEGARTTAENLTLPGGTTLSAPQGSVGYSLAKYLGSSDPAPRTFVFDNLVFQTGSNEISADSKATVDAVVLVLKAFPTAKVKLVGYTDNSGDPAANVTLSQTRATKVADSMAALGVDPARITAAGEGDANPIADNSTEQGRAQNRRTELVVTEK
jgi:outer membrane protein OmpA-like peptidoglycan-associated protein